jgi:hypothetical protein
VAYQGVLARSGWLRIYPSEPDSGNADVGMDKYNNNAPLSSKHKLKTKRDEENFFSDNGTDGQ